MRDRRGQGVLARDGARRVEDADLALAGGLGQGVVARVEVLALLHDLAGEVLGRLGLRRETAV